MATPNSLTDLLMQQPLEVQMNALLEKYLIHHPDSPVVDVVRRAITTPQIETKQKILAILMAYG